MSRSERQFTKILAGAVAGVGLVSTLLLLTDPPSSLEADNLADAGPTVFELNSTKLKVLSQNTPEETNRGLASVVLSEARAAQNQSVVKLDCDMEKPNTGTKEIRIRLRGENCLGDNDNPATTSIKNVSNGYIATVFHKSDSTYTTDYINLVEGENDIAVTFEAQGQSVTKHMIVNRDPASKNVSP